MGDNSLRKPWTTHYITSTQEHHHGIPANSPLGQAYIKDHDFCCEWAFENRMEMARRVESVLQALISPTHGLLYTKAIDCRHNTVTLYPFSHFSHFSHFSNLWLHRKGATPAHKRHLGVVPGNMLDGCYITEGKGCEEALYSSAHGAGRIMSRSAAKTSLSLEDFKAEIDAGKITAKVTESTLDEAPKAYKDIEQVLQRQEDSTDVILHIKPIINIKA